MTPRKRRSLGVPLLLVWLAGAPRATADPARHVLGPDEAQHWHAVAALLVEGQQSCTASLISATEAITAAHCVVDRASGARVLPENITLVLGQSADGQAALRGVAATAFPPDYLSKAPITDLSGLSADVALLQLDAAVAPDDAAPLPIADWPDPLGSLVDIIGYERGGPRSATLRENCLAVEAGPGVTVVACDVISGLSGAPVVLHDPSGTARLVGAVSSRGNGMAYVVTIAPHLAELRGIIAK